MKIIITYFGVTTPTATSGDQQRIVRKVDHEASATPAATIRRRTATGATASRENIQPKPARKREGAADPGSLATRRSESTAATLGTVSRDSV